MKKTLACGILCVFMILPTADASDLPMLPIKSAPKPAASDIPPINNYYPPHNYYINNYYYSTTLTTKELRARRKARKQAKLEEQCKNMKVKSSKCEMFKED